MSIVVTFGEVLMRLSTTGDERFSQADEMAITYGGSEANISAALAQWKVSSAHITALPSHDLGLAAAAHLRRLGVDMQFTSFNEGRLGLYFLEPGVSIRSPKIIYDRFDSAFAKMRIEDFSWETVLRDARWFHWSGITPAISAVAAESLKEAIDVARAKGVTVSGDINYRRNLWQYGKQPLVVMPELIARTNIVIGSHEDFQNCAGISASDFKEGCAKMMKKFPDISKIATTTRFTEHTSHQQISGVLINHEGQLSSKQYTLNPVVDRIGAGDAFMAGLIYASLEKKTDQEIIDFAAAACALKHTIPADILLCAPSEVEDLVHLRNIGKLLR